MGRVTMERHPIQRESIPGHSLGGYPVGSDPIEGRPIQGQPLDGHSLQGHPIGAPCCMRGHRTHQYEATTGRHHASFDRGPEEPCRPSGSLSCLRRHAVLLWSRSQCASAGLTIHPRRVAAQECTAGNAADLDDSQTTF